MESIDDKKIKDSTRCNKMLEILEIMAKINSCSIGFDGKIDELIKQYGKMNVADAIIAKRLILIEDGYDIFMLFIYTLAERDYQIKMLKEEKHV